MKTNRYRIILAAMAMSFILTGCQGGGEKKDQPPQEESEMVEEMSQEEGEEEGAEEEESEKDQYFDELYAHIQKEAKKTQEDKEKKEDEDADEDEDEDQEDEDKKEDEEEALPDDPEAAKRLEQKDNFEEKEEEADEDSAEDKDEEDSESEEDSEKELDKALSGLVDDMENGDEEGFAQVDIGENDERKDLMIAGKDGKTKKKTIHFIHIKKSVDEEETTELVMTEGRDKVELYYYTNEPEKEELGHFATAKLEPASMSFNIIQSGEMEKDQLAEVFQEEVPKLLSSVKHYLSQSDLSISLEDLGFGTDDQE